MACTPPETYLPWHYITMENPTIWRCISYLNMGIFQPAMLVYRRVHRRHCIARWCFNYFSMFTPKFWKNPSNFTCAHFSDETILTRKGQNGQPEIRYWGTISHKFPLRRPYFLGGFGGYLTFPWGLSIEKISFIQMFFTELIPTTFMFNDWSSFSSTFLRWVMKKNSLRGTVAEDCFRSGWTQHVCFYIEFSQLSLP